MASSTNAIGAQHTFAPAATSKTEAETVSQVDNYPIHGMTVFSVDRFYAGMVEDFFFAICLLVSIFPLQPHVQTTAATFAAH